jgi:hypothetical protein
MRRAGLLDLLAVVLVWLGLGYGLSRITGRVVDWFVMTDELLYERLAISIAETGSPLPRIHGELIASLNQLYPLIIAPVYRNGLVPESLHDAHVLNAFVMTSASVPAFLLARSVVDRRWAAYAVAVLSVCVPWMTLSSFLLTEVVAYPAFLWAVLAIHRAAASPGAGRDALALLALVLAALARVQFLVLVFVLPLAVVIHELGFAEGSRRTRLRNAARNAVASHRVLAAVYALLALVAVGLAAARSLSRVLGTYAVTTEGVFIEGLEQSFAEHLAAIALSLAILPFVVAAGWMVATLVRPDDRGRHAFASVATVTIVLITLQVSSYNLRFGAGGIVRERYLFYVVPLILVALACALVAPRWPRWSLLVPAGIVAAGFATNDLPRFQKLNVDTPIAVLHDRIVELGESTRGAQWGLVLATLVLILLFVQAARFLQRPVLAALLVAMVAFALPAGTAYAFSRLFAVDGTAARPLTVDQGGVFNWIDRRLGPDAEVTMLPFPTIPGDYFAGVAFWWDLEFWNKSVVRAAHRNHEFEETPPTFAKHQVRVDPETGRVNISPTRHVAQFVNDARFRISGQVVFLDRDTFLIEAGDVWKVDWISTGLYSDGWTRPGQTATIRVFARGGGVPITRSLSFSLRGPPYAGAEPRRVRVVSDLSDVETVVAEPVGVSVLVCVPPQGYTEVRLNVDGHSQFLGDPTTVESFGRPRQVGVLVGNVVLADVLKGECRTPA